jgi:hypothetical protein
MLEALLSRLSTIFFSKTMLCKLNKFSENFGYPKTKRTKVFIKLLHQEENPDIYRLHVQVYVSMYCGLHFLFRRAHYHS